MKEFLKKLNKEQYEAATTICGPLLIIAGAGSGKTMTLVSRVANMIDEGIDPKSILLLTFTNKAAKEMKNRIARDIGYKANDITASTFHSFCSSFLRRHSHLIGIDNDFTIIDSQDAVEVMSIVKTEFIAFQKERGIEYKAKDFPNKKTISGMYSYSINNNVKLKEVVEKEGYSLYYDEIENIAKRYIEYKRNHMFFDYDDLLLYTKKILKKFDNIRVSTSEHYKYISCDEYQDTNFLQDEILDLLCSEHNNLAVVGDDNQSIYKFRGAKIENILTFEQRHKNCKVVVLKENYRSSQQILDFANATMSYAKEGIRKDLIGQFNGTKPEMLVVKSDSDENFSILNEIKMEHFRGTPLKEMAVIIRFAAQSYGLENLLAKNNIPFEKFGGLKFFEKTVVRDIISFLRVIVNEKDEIALYRILQLYPGIGKTYSNRITVEVAKSSIDKLNDLYTKNRFYDLLVELYDVINYLKNESLEVQLKYLIENYYPKVYERKIALSKTSESNKMEERQKIIRDLEEAKTLYVLASDYSITANFLEDIVLDGTSDDSEKEDKLNITTIHSAKGLEYDVVFFMDAIENITPMCEEDDEENNEELRCVYVAVTRARKKLFVYVPKTHTNPMFNIFSAKCSRFFNKKDILTTLNINKPNDSVFDIEETDDDIWNIF